MLLYHNILLQNLFTYLPCMPFYPTIFSQQFFTMLIYRNVFCTKFVHLPTMRFYRNILSQNLFTYLPCRFIVILCHKICSPTYHAVLSLYVVTKFVQLPTMLIYRNLFSQNLYTYLPCGFTVTFFHKTDSPTFHAALS